MPPINNNLIAWNLFLMQANLNFNVPFFGQVMQPIQYQILGVRGIGQSTSIQIQRNVAGVNQVSNFGYLAFFNTTDLINYGLPIGPGPFIIPGPYGSMRNAAGGSSQLAAIVFLEARLSFVGAGRRNIQIL